MAASRVVYQNWIVELGYDPQRTPAFPVEEDAAEPADIREVVAAAVASLTADEREFIEQYYYMGRSHREISERSGRAVYKLEALHQRAIRKLKARLAGFVQMRFGVKTSPRAKTCPLCLSEHREEIDKLIAAHDPEATWGPVLAVLRKRYGITIRSPQVVIGHEKYHGRTNSD